MKDAVYLETSVISYYTGRPSRDIIVLAHQEITRQWWEKAFREFDIFISQAVIDEVGVGDPIAAKKRLDTVRDFKHLEINRKVEEFTGIYIRKLEIPPKAVNDAIHIAVASIHEVEYLVTWNCSHIANGTIIKKINDYPVH